MNDPFGVRFDITFSKKAQSLTGMDLQGKIRVFVYIHVINTAPDSPRTLRKNMNDPFGVRFDITFLKKAQSLTGMDLQGKIRVFVYTRVINTAPDSPRTLRKNMNDPFGVRFDITFFKKAQSLTGMDLQGKIRVFVYTQVINTAPDSPRTLQKT